MASAVLVFFFGVSFFAFSGNEEKTDEQLLQGTWVCVSAKTGDEKRDRNTIGHTIKVAGDKIDGYRKDGQYEGTFNFTLNPKKMPKEVDSKIVKGEKEIIILGIYEFKTGEAWFCMSGRDAPRPTSFDVAGGPNDLRVLVYRRQKE